MSFFSKKNLVFLLMPLCFIQPSFAICGVIPVKSIKASSSFSDKDVSYDASYASDSRLSTIWMEGEEGSGLGDWIEFSFEKDVTVSKLVFYNGNWDSRDFYQRYNRVKSFQVKFSNGSIQKIDLADKMEKQVVALEKPVTTKSLRLVLKEVYKGTTFQDTPISEVMFFSPDPTSVVDNLKVKASSFMPADSGATYVADNVFDSMVDTMWCEGKSDSGVGESLTIALNKNQSIKELRLLNGVVVSNDVYKKNNRISSMLVESQGFSKEFPIADNFFNYISIPLEGISTNNIKLTIKAVNNGSEFNDTCVSDIQVIAQ